MAKPITLLFLFFLAGCINAGSEKVNWATPSLFSAREVKFTSGFIRMQCNSCKCFEIRSRSGLTGLFIAGDGRFEIPSIAISDTFSNCMIRFNPAEAEKQLAISGKAILDDHAFYNSSMEVLGKVFRHCYHSGMNALIPEKNAFALNFYSEKYGDILASYTPDTSIVYSFSNNKKY